ncbi:MAG: hypothetical protein ACOC4M_09055 [Promethearchaeia archaeon]
MKLCKKCGIEIEDIEREYCPNCGEKIPNFEASELKNPIQESIFFRSKGNLMLLISWLFALGLTVYILFSGSFPEYIIARATEAIVSLSIAFALYFISYRVLEKNISHLLVFTFLSLVIAHYLLFYLFYTYFLIFFAVVLVISLLIQFGRKKLSEKFGLFQSNRIKKTVKKNIAKVFIFGLIFSGVAVINFDALARIVWAPPKYPYENPETLKNEAEKISDNLEHYIEGWFKGENPAEIPENLIPDGVDPGMSKNFRLVKYENVEPSQQWLYRNASYGVDFDRLQGGLPDPHVSYLVLSTPLAPFGNNIVIEGEYPYCRFFSIQITAPFDGKSYTLRKTYGPTEVSIVDTDIPPIPGHENPFLPNTNRTVENRTYRVNINLEIGDAVDLNPDFEPPYRNSDGNISGSLLVNQGPYWNSPIWGKGIGKWNTGLFWIRYYAPDKDKDAWGGVDLPRVYYQLPTGEKYYILSDASGWEQESNKEISAPSTEPTEPSPAFGPDLGWIKSFGIFRNIFIGVFQAWNKLTPTNIDYVNELDLGVTGRGESQPAPHHYEPHATTNNYASYLGRSMSLGEDKVVVLTGKLPTIPKTVNGNSTLETSQVRYWSLGTYDTNNPLSPTTSCCLSSIMDEELTVDENNRFVIVYSRESERPSNAYLSNGVNWVNWGPISSASILLRWVSVMPEWSCSFNPHEENLPWEVSDLAGSDYDPNLIGENNHQGFMGEYLPKIHYMSRQEFEALGSNLTADEIPEWEKLEGTGKSTQKMDSKREILGSDHEILRLSLTRNLKPFKDFLFIPELFSQHRFSLLNAIIFAIGFLFFLSQNYHLTLENRKKFLKILHWE